jgi:hypothetical protein
MEQRGAKEVEVLEFVARTVGVRCSKLSMSTRLLGDLGIDGDDADEFFKDFSETFHVNVSQLDLSRHFGGEGCLPWEIPGMLFRAIAELVRCRLSDRTEEERVGLIPITIGELVCAAKTGHWCASPAEPDNQRG